MPNCTLTKRNQLNFFHNLFKYFSCLALCYFGLVSFSCGLQAQRNIEHQDSVIKEVKQLYKVGNINTLDSIFDVCYKEFLNNKLDSLKFRQAIVYISYPMIKKAQFRRAKRILDIGHKYYHPRHGDSLQTVNYIEGELGNIYSRLGDYARAKNILKIELETHKRSNKPKQIATTYNNLGIAYFYNNEIDKAIECYRKSLKISSDNDLFRKAFYAHMKLTDIFTKESEIDSAEMHLSQMIEIQDISQKNYMSSAIQKAQAELYISKRMYPEAIQYLKRSLNDEFTRTSSYRRATSKQYAQIANLYLKLNMLDSAHHYIELGTKKLTGGTRFSDLTTDMVSSENTFYQLALTKANIELRKYELSGAEEFIIQAIHDLKIAEQPIRMLSSTYLLEDQKMLMMSSIKDINNLKVQILKYAYEAQLYNVDQIDSLYVTLKSGLLTEMLARSKKFHSYSSEVQNEITTLELEIEELYRQYHQDGADKLLDSILQKRLIIDSKFEYDQSQAEIDYLNHNFIDYFIAADSVYGFSRLGKRVMFKILGTRNECINLIESFANDMQNRNIYKQSLVLHDLYQFLVKPFAPLPDDFSIITHSQLEKIPFDILVDDDSRYLIESHMLTQRINRITYPVKIQDELSIYVSYPNYEKNNPLRISELPNARVEAMQVAHKFKNYHLVPSLSKKSLNRALHEYSIFHYAGHAESGDYRGKLILGADENYNSIYGNDISAIKSNNFLTVLSACETGKGNVHMTEGSYSLARAFIEGGSHHVVNSLWTVNDKSTQEIMTKFYDHLLKDESPSSALRKAKLHFLNSHSSIAHNPYYWAGLILTTNEPYKGNGFSYLLYIAIAIAVSAMAFYITLKIKKMKHLLSVLIFIFLTLSAIAQQDHSWFILDGENNRTAVQTSIQSSFRIPEVKGTQHCCNPQAEDDLFFIFDDGTFYNSRYDNANGSRDWNFSDISTASGIGNLDINSAKSVAFLYWTNLYDTDDPPEALVNWTGNNLNNVASHQTSSLSANHMVVPNRDITLIIPTPKLKANSLILDAHINGQGNLADYFDLSEVFEGGNSAIFPLTGIQMANNNVEFQFNQNAPYHFINLRATDALYQFVNPDFPLQVQFVIKRQDESNSEDANLIYQLNENIGGEFDPNELVAYKNCEIDGLSEKQKVMYYTGQFYNTGNSAAHNISLIIQHPTFQFGNNQNLNIQDIRQLKNLEFRNGNRIIDWEDISISNDGNKLKFDFIDLQLAPCVSDSMAYEEMRHGIQFDFLFEYESPHSHEIEGKVLFANNELILDYKDYVPFELQRENIYSQTTAGKKYLSTLSKKCQFEKSESQQEVDNKSWCGLDSWLCYVLLLLIILIIIIALKRLR